MPYQVYASNIALLDMEPIGVFNGFLEAKRALKSYIKMHKRGWGRIFSINEDGESTWVYSTTSDGNEHWAKGFNYILMGESKCQNHKK